MNLKSMKAKANEWVNTHKQDISLGLIIFLACLLCFGLGYLLAKNERKEPLKFEETGDLFGFRELLLIIESAVNLPQSFTGHVGINLGGNRGLMAQEFLQGSQVYALT